MIGLEPAYASQVAQDGQDRREATRYAPAVIATSPAQLGLFDVAEMAMDTAFSTARRIQLDATSWVEYVPGWLAGSEKLFATLLEMPEWEQRERWIIERMMIEPRLTAEYPHLADAPSFLQEVAATLAAHYHVPYDGLWLNLYRNHRDSTAWHGDWPSCKRRECIVPVLSLGATRRFHLQHRSGGRSTVLTVHAGDLVVMGGRCQRDWRHCVPKQATPAGARISVNFMSLFQATPEDWDGPGLVESIVRRSQPRVTAGD
jgi:alkylated DNA repair dioxygenase AlkB